MTTRNSKDPLKKLYQVLIKFKAEEIQENVVRQFPSLRWAGLWSDIGLQSRIPPSRVIATTVCQLISSADLAQETIENAVENLQLKALYSCGSKVWHLFELSKVEDEDEYAIIDNVGRLCSQVGQALDLRVRGVRGPDDCVLLAVGTGARRINAAIHPQLRCVLVTMKNDSYLQTIAKILGFRSVVNSHLSGQHAPSLLQMLRKKRGACSLGEFFPQNTAKDRSGEPNRTPIGLYFGKRSYGDIQHEDEENKVRLQTLTVKSDSQPPHLRCQLVLSSKDVITSLQDMLKMGIVEKDNVFCQMIRKSRNDVTVKFED